MSRPQTTKTLCCLGASVTEIPEHLLKRAAAARAAKSGNPPEEEDSKPPAEDKSARLTPKTEETTSQTEEEVKPAPLAPYHIAHRARHKIPWWAASVLVLLPLWAFTYVGTLERPPKESTGVLAIGEAVYGARCASCHGATGGGGSGYLLTGGEVIQTFPSLADHVVWVVQGSDHVGLGNSYGDPLRNRIVNGGMPGWGDVLTKEELLGAVLYERAYLSGSADDTALAESVDHTDGLDLGGYFDPITITPGEVSELLASAFHDDEN